MLKRWFFPIVATPIEGWIFCCCCCWIYCLFPNCYKKQSINTLQNIKYDPLELSPLQIFSGWRNTDVLNVLNNDTARTDCRHWSWSRLESRQFPRKESAASKVFIVEENVWNVNLILTKIFQQFNLVRWVWQHRAWSGGQAKGQFFFTLKGLFLTLVVLYHVRALYHVEGFLYFLITRPSTNSKQRWSGQSSRSRRNKTGWNKNSNNSI